MTRIHPIHEAKRSIFSSLTVGSTAGAKWPQNLSFQCYIKKSEFQTYHFLVPTFLSNQTEPNIRIVKKNHKNVGRRTDYDLCLLTHLSSQTHLNIQKVEFIFLLTISQQPNKKHNYRNLTEWNRNWPSCWKVRREIQETTSDWTQEE